MTLDQILNSAESKAELAGLADFGIVNYDVNACFTFVKLLDNDLSKLDSASLAIFNAELKQRYLKAKWIAFAKLKQRECLDLLEKNLCVTKGFDLEIFKIKEQVRALLLGLMDYRERDDLKIKIREALMANKEFFPVGGQLSVSSWIRDVIAKVGLQLQDRLKESQYYVGDVNFKKLNFPDQLFLKQVIDVYKYCLYSSQTPEGLDEAINITDNNGRLKILEFGQLIDVPPLDKSDEQVIDYFINQAQKNQGQVGQANFQAYQNLQTRYQEILSQLLPNGVNAPKGESHIPEVILDQLNNNLALKDVAGVAGNLQNLIQLKALAPLVKSKNFSSDFGIFVESRVGLGYKDELTRLTPQVFGLFLQFLLAGKLKLTLEQSAVLALHLVKYLGQTDQKDFMTVAYGDLKSGVFKWREVVGENGKLRFK